MSARQRECEERDGRREREREAKSKSALIEAPQKDGRFYAHGECKVTAAEKEKIRHDKGDLGKM